MEKLDLKKFKQLELKKDAAKKIQGGLTYSHHDSTPFDTPDCDVDAICFV
jgi:hypothetical protein